MRLLLALPLLFAFACASTTPAMKAQAAETGCACSEEGCGCATGGEACSCDHD